MKLGIIASYENEKTFETVKNLGLDGMEFTVNFDKDSKRFLEDIPEITRRMKKYGLCYKDYRKAAHGEAAPRDGGPGNLQQGL